MANTQGAHRSICASETQQVMMNPSCQQLSTGDALERRREEQKLTLYKLGLIEIVFGLISVISGVVSLIYAPTLTSSRIGSWHLYYSSYDATPPLAYASQGIWCGIAIFASGVAGMKAKRNPSVYVFNTNSVLSTIAAAFAVLMALMSLVLVTSTRGFLVFHIILAAVGGLSAIICSVHMGVSCCTKCPVNKPTRRRVHYQRYQGPVTYTAQPSHQMLQLANGQYMMLVPCQPVQPIMSGVGPGPGMYQPYQTSVPPPVTMTLPPLRTATPPPSCVVTPPVSEQVIPPPQHIVMPPLTHMGMMRPPQMPIASALPPVLPPPQSVSPPPVQTQQMNGQQPSQNMTSTQENSEDPPPYTPGIQDSYEGVDAS